MSTEAARSRAVACPGHMSHFCTAPRRISSKTLIRAQPRLSPVCTSLISGAVTAWTVYAVLQLSHISSQLRFSHSLSKNCSSVSAVSRQERIGFEDNSSAPAWNFSSDGRASKRSHVTTSATSSATGSYSRTQCSKCRRIRAKYSASTPSTASPKAVGSGRKLWSEARAASTASPSRPRAAFWGAPRSTHMPSRASANPRRRLGCLPC
mmetsp:Transcript_19942/g.37569  ORF Transcript_19942/g.37569 Transcript_19942/m.37569 type:complete len:208 (-) Transcript_19942:1879-2502(-)